MVGEEGAVVAEGVGGVRSGAAGVFPFGFGGQCYVVDGYGCAAERVGVVGQVRAELAAEVASVGPGDVVDGVAAAGELRRVGGQDRFVLLLCDEELGEVEVAGDANGVGRPFIGAAGGAAQSMRKTKATVTA